MSRADEDRRVDKFIEDAETQLVFLKDETQSFAYLNVQINLELLKELRWQRRRRGHAGGG